MGTIYVVRRGCSRKVSSAGIKFSPSSASWWYYVVPR
jgi:hypothetical protein